MKVSWTAGLTEEEKTILRQDFKSMHEVRKKLISILSTKLESVDALSNKVDGYEKPGWPYMQADFIGYKRALNEIISLLED